MLQFYEMDINEIDKLMQDYILVQGWDYDENHIGSIIDLKITDPMGREWLLEECIRVLEQPLRVGDKNQIDALKSVEFFNLLYNWGYQESSWKR